MNSDPNVRTVMLVTALAAVAATAWATNESFPHTTWTSESDAFEAATISPARDELVAPESEMVNARETASTSEAADGSEPAADTIPSNAHIPAASEPPPAIDPKVETPMRATMDEGSPQPPITVEERRLSLDERIQGNVMDVLLSQNLSGKIGVESQDAVVTLTGYTTTVGQAQRAGRYAAGVEGVRAVQNQIRPRVGGSV
ncbi:MAG TPA: BON domain-containing protein [Usitatibacter sp.]|nr:BON domain-containing protein [Usitatibacter sp.]